MTRGPGRSFGAYFLGPKVGAGGMAAVFAARHRSGSGAARLVALKVMSTALASEDEYRAMFLREARIASRLEHPNVVRVYDSGEFEGELFLAMELVEGASLARLQREVGGPFPPAVALRVLHDVLRGLHHAHELIGEGGEALGLVHQDVSPHNVIVGYDGSARLLDFGVARLSQRERSRTDNIRGKPGYLAPEQITGGRLDRRVDVFAAGVTGFELLSGRLLFAADTLPAIYEQITGGDAPRLEGVPGPVADVIARALARDPERRWPTAEAFRRALREAAKSADLEIADEETVAELVRLRAPATWSKRSIERTLTDAARPPTEVADVHDVHDVHDLPTQAPRRAPPDATPGAAAATLPVAVPDSSRRTVLVVGLALGAALTVALTVGSRSFLRAKPSAPSAPALSAAVASGPSAQSARSAPTPIPEVSVAAAASPAVPVAPSAAASVPRPLAAVRASSTASAKPSLPATSSASAVPSVIDDPFARP